ncbi:MAG: 4-(cytidine 5'-diphospho)-2-C-methyl-D-erythritol kinase [Spirochaetes bacterium]|nr:4-(cytidine 5'-diphospho)-2-C-methyl-D-erythritol kinase [Spirochaetota bacterium]
MIDSIKAYAKINLHLEVLNKRPDGYHNICSIMAKVDIFDLLQLEHCTLCNPDSVICTLKCVGGRNASVVENIPHEQNLIARAVDVYCRHAGIGLQVAIAIQKNIPAQAGLGGGSADAAATLLLLNNSLNCFNIQQLSAIAHTIGADVPFCLNGNVALCEGIGQIVTPLHPIKLPAYAIIVYDEIYCNTKEAYTSLKRGPDKLPSLKEDILSLWYNGDVISLLNVFKNDFQDTIFTNYPELVNVYNTLKHYQPEFVQLTGSGSAIFALFFDKVRAENVFGQIQSRFSQVFFAKLLMI